MGEWRRVRIGDCCDIVKGETGLASATPGSFPLVATAAERRSCNTYQFDTEAVCIPLVSSTGHGKKTLNHVHYQSGKFALGTILAAVIPRDSKILSARYLHLYLSHFKDTVLVPLMKGAANVTLPLKGIASVELPLPPVKEQGRLVDLIERIEGEHRELLAEAGLQANLLKQLRQSILQEAVEGKLTADWRKRHPVVKGDPQYDAAALLAQIKVEKERLVRTGKLRKEKPLPEVSEAEKPFERPVGWVWSRVAAVAKQHVDCPHATPHYMNEGYICLRAPNIVESRLFLDEKRYVSRGEYESRIQRLQPQRDDLVYIREGGRLGVAGIIDCDDPVCLGQRLMLIRFFEKHTGLFASFYLNAPCTYREMVGKTIGSAAPHVNVRDVISHPFPLPPLAEQQAIATRVDALMSMVNDLEKQVAERKEQAQMLMQAVLREAFADGRAEELPVESPIAEDSSNLQLPTTRRRVPRLQKNESIAPDLVAMVAEPSAPYDASPEGGRKRHAGHDMYNKAALAGYITARCSQPWQPIGKVKLMKLFYLVQRKSEMALTETFIRRAAGPVDDAIHKFLPLAQKQGWIHVLPKQGPMTPIVPGRSAGTAVQIASKQMGAALAPVEAMLSEMKSWKWQTLECWATVEPVARELLSAGQESTVAAIKSALSADPVWRPKLEKEAFSDAALASALRGLQEFGFLANEEKKPVVSSKERAPVVSHIPQRILDSMKNGGMYSRSDIVAVAGISIADWNWAIRQLKEEGKVRQIGEKRGAQYEKK